MRTFSCLILTSLFFWNTWAFADSLRGIVLTLNGNYFLHNFVDGKTTKIETDTHEVAIALYKLKHQDSLVGTGTYLDDSTLLLESIDFVSLQRLIGEWKAPSTIIRFEDYTHVKFHLPGGTNSQYSYALAPAEGDSWRIFFTDKSSVVLGSLSVQNSKAQMELYNSKTGAVYQRYDLKKINP